MSVTSTFAAPVPTPYQSPYYGGNINIPQGYEGPAVPGNASPVYGPTYSGATMYTNGAQSGGSSPAYVAPVLGTNTQQQITLPVPQQQQQTQQQQNTGGIPPVDMSQYQGWNDQNAINADWAANWQSKTGTSGSGSQPGVDYSPYFASLDEQLGIAGGSAEAAKGQVGSQYTQGLADLGLGNQQQQDILNNQKVETNQNTNKTLKDISSNLRNSFMAGNIYLGARGAGDSSAANQFSYALTKMGNQQRGDVQSQAANILKDIGQRETNLAATFNNEKQKLATQRDTGIQNVVQWFEGVKQQLAGFKGDALKQNSEQAYTTAVNELNRIKTEFSNTSNMLQSWALSNSKTLAEAKANLNGISAQGYNQPTQQPLTGTPVVTGADVNIPKWGGSTGNDQQKQVANSIWNTASGNWLNPNPTVANKDWTQGGF